MAMLGVPDGQPALVRTVQEVQVLPVKGYHVKRIYVIVCARCNEDITRPESGEDVTSKAEADEVIREHERVWHS